ncbi:hypothetical protein ColTof3_14734 [Colletotrichum tofieldiae]|nr:hypothetical protein ColTof3_14734 [Colletotrichum tofieldiae]
MACTTCTTAGVEVIVGFPQSCPSADALPPKLGGPGGVAVGRARGAAGWAWRCRIFQGAQEKASCRSSKARSRSRRRKRTTPSRGISGGVAPVIELDCGSHTLGRV